MTLAEQLLAEVPEDEQDAVVQAAVEACEQALRRAYGARMGFWSASRLAQVAAQRGARAVLTADPTLPNGVRIAFEPVEVPPHLAPKRPQ